MNEQIQTESFFHICYCAFRIPPYNAPPLSRETELKSKATRRRKLSEITFKEITKKVFDTTSYLDKMSVRFEKPQGKAL